MLAVMEKRKALAPPLDVEGSPSIMKMRSIYNQERAWWNAIKPELGAVEDLEVQGPIRQVPIRIYRPLHASCSSTLVYLHGGGWVLGNLDTHDRVMRLLCEYSGATVVGVDYALSPEHRLPVALDEVLAVCQWVKTYGHAYDLHSESLTLGGDSAGANLAVAATQALHRDAPASIKGLLLYYGAFGLSDSDSWKTFGTAEYEFTWEEMLFYLDSYLGSATLQTDARYNVLRGNVAFLPSAFIAAAQCDPLCDDSSALFDAMQANGIAAELKIYPGVLHGFIHYSRMLELATEALRDGATALREFSGLN
jgi:acetyl esterase